MKFTARLQLNHPARKSWVAQGKLHGELYGVKFHKAGPTFVSSNLVTDKASIDQLMRDDKVDLAAVGRYGKLPTSGAAKKVETIVEPEPTPETPSKPLEQAESTPEPAPKPTRLKYTPPQRNR